MSIRRLIERIAAGPSRRLSLADWAETGWHRLESNAGADWVWSTGRAELRVPPGARQLEFRFTSIHSKLTGRPQRVQFFLDENPVHSLATSEENFDVRFRIRGGSRLRIECDTARPIDFPNHADTRLLGLCLLEYRCRGAAAPVPRNAIADDLHEVTPNGPPLTLQVEFTAACHLKCLMCARSIGAAGGSLHMSPAIWQRVLRGTRGVEAINFLGNGEPFAHPRFVDALAEVDALGIRTHITTSGDLIGDDKARRMSALRHLQRVTVSIDSPDPAVYEKIRGQSLARPLRGIENLSRHLANGAQLRILAVVMRNNIESLAGFPGLLRETGVRQLALRGVIDTKGMPHEVPAYDARDRAILRGIRDECETMGITLALLPAIPQDVILIGSVDQHDEGLHAWNPADAAAQPIRPLPPTRACYDPWEMAMITHEGLVYPCEVYNNMEPMGSLAEDEFDAIWRGDRFRDMRRRLLAARSLVCRNCPRRHFGDHAFQRYAVQIDLSASRLGGGGRERLVVRNAGTVAWDAATELNIGTSRPRDRADSPLYHSSWLSRNRVATFREPLVAPGQTATFEFEIDPNTPPFVEHFQLVVENRRWLPDGRFTIDTRHSHFE